MNTIITTVLVLGITGIFSAAILWFVAKRFFIHEDPRIAEIEEQLPGANCGSCGFSGCHGFAEACVKATSLEGFRCPGAGNAAMIKIGHIVGLAATISTPKVAIVKCNGSCENRPQLNHYDGLKLCAVEASLYVGESDCANSCLGCGDCVRACPYDAIHLNTQTGLPHVDFDKCVGCGACANTCPRSVIELIENTGTHPLVWVTCNNHDRGAIAMKECTVSCIGCGKCMKVCPQQAVTVKDFLAHIDQQKCVGCETCVAACPRKSITTISTNTKA